MDPYGMCACNNAHALILQVGKDRTCEERYVSKAVSVSGIVPTVGQTSHLLWLVQNKRFNFVGVRKTHKPLTTQFTNHPYGQSREIWDEAWEDEAEGFGEIPLEKIKNMVPLTGAVLQAVA
eukprot:3224834-Heterocapsa_arctica.AAC.1